MAGSAAATICSMWQVLQGFCKKGLSLQEDFEASWGLSSEGFRSESVPGELRTWGAPCPGSCLSCCHLSASVLGCLGQGDGGNASRVLLLSTELPWSACLGAQQVKAGLLRPWGWFALPCLLLCSREVGIYTSSGDELRYIRSRLHSQDPPDPHSRKALTT